MSKRQIREKGDLSIIEQSIGQRGNLQTMKRQGAKCMTLEGKANGI